MEPATQSYYKQYSMKLATQSAIDNFSCIYKVLRPIKVLKSR